jgi:hypothetical protein
LGAFKLEDLPGALADDNPGLELRGIRVKRLLSFFLNCGLVFYDPEGKRYHPTTLARHIVGVESEVDWLPSACMALSIIMESAPGTDLAQTIAEELHLDEPRAQVVLSALQSLPWLNKRESVKPRD